MSRFDIPNFFGCVYAMDFLRRISLQKPIFLTLINNTLKVQIYLEPNYGIPSGNIVYVLMCGPSKSRWLAKKKKWPENDVFVALLIFIWISVYLVGFLIPIINEQHGTFDLGHRARPPEPHFHRE